MAHSRQESYHFQASQGHIGTQHGYQSFHDASGVDKDLVEHLEAEEAQAHVIEQQENAQLHDFLSGGEVPQQPQNPMPDFLANMPGAVYQKEVLSMVEDMEATNIYEDDNLSMASARSNTKFLQQLSHMTKRQQKAIQNPVTRKEKRIAKEFYGQEFDKDDEEEKLPEEPTNQHL